MLQVEGFCMEEILFLPDAEFDVMQIIWEEETPISSVQVFNLSVDKKKWKPQTVLTLLTRLEKRGFVASEKRGKERYYWPVVAREDYLKQETGQFVRRFHKNSVTGLMSALFGGKSPKGRNWMKLKHG